MIRSLKLDFFLTFNPGFQSLLLSPHYRGNIDLMVLQPFVGKTLIDHELLIFQVGILKFSSTRSVSGIATLTALSLIANGVNSGLCRYEGVNPYEEKFLENERC